MISGDVTVARLLEEHPELIEVLAGYSPHLRLLSDLSMRRAAAARVTVAEAARIAGVPPADLIAALRTAVGEEGKDCEPGPSRPSAAPTGEPRRPAALADLPESRRVHLDVREGIRRNEEPIGRIMAAVRGLRADQVLVLHAPFEPVPLYDVLGKRGFCHWTESHASDDWSVWFYHGTPGATDEPAAPREDVASTILDVRELEPPEPMVRVLEALERLEPGERLEVLHARRPMFLYPQLDERGFAHETDEPEPGLVRIVIRRGAG
jgi:uncharacterized protein (DUF2249 family)